MSQQESYRLEPHRIGDLVSLLQRQGYAVVGPTVRDGAVVFEELETAQDLPRGIGERQQPGHYRLEQRDDDSLFGYSVGPQSFKRFFYPPRLRLWRARREGDDFAFEPGDDDLPVKPIAVLGVRACDLAALAVLDRVLLEGPHVDEDYAHRRRDTFVIAVNCTVAGGTCFCVSMSTGPRARRGYDLALTEVYPTEPSSDPGAEHYLVVDAASERGRALVEALELPDARQTECDAAERSVERAAANMGRQMEAGDVRELLYRHGESPQWDEVAQRCLACGNCTLVCPTCFCTTIADHSDLAGQSAERHRRWDSCFTADFSYIHGGVVRGPTAQRYRQWITHKLASWHDQFGTSGCVGCGRCITWCPVGIDITEEVGRLRAREARHPQASGQAARPSREQTSGARADEE